MKGNVGVVMVYCVHKFIGRAFSENDISFYKDGFSTHKEMMRHLQSIGLEVEMPKFISHKTISESLKTGKFTFLILVNPKTKQLHITFIKGYDRYNDKLISFSDKDFEPFELSELEIKYYFTAQVPINTQFVRNALNYPSS